MLGFQETNIIVARANVMENISKAFSNLEKSRKYNTNVPLREITTVVVVPRTSRYQIMATISQLFNV